MKRYLVTGVLIILFGFLLGCAETTDGPVKVVVHGKITVSDQHITEVCYGHATIIPLQETVLPFDRIWFNPNMTVKYFTPEGKSFSVREKIEVEIRFGTFYVDPQQAEYLIKRFIAHEAISGNGKLLTTGLKMCL